ncbi:MAG: thymidine kinase [Bacteriovoracaceae bacterium]|nr:thymidine kinase [Bacteriovoracaceae bacterium]
MSSFLNGSIEVICGPMFSGKTEELIRRVRRAQIARQKVQIFKPTFDVRYSEDQVVSHSAIHLEAKAVANPQQILEELEDATRVVAIDEVQFFPVSINNVVAKLARRGCRVICAGLDLDYRAAPFAPIPYLLSMADEVVKLHAICTLCGSPATRTQRIVNSTEHFLLGEKDAYQARCRRHYEGPEAMEDFIPSSEKEIPQAFSKSQFS